MAVSRRTAGVIGLLLSFFLGNASTSSATSEPVRVPAPVLDGPVIESLGRQLDSLSTLPHSQWLTGLSLQANLGKLTPALSPSEQAARVALASLTGAARMGDIRRANPGLAAPLDKLDAAVHDFNHAAASRPELVDALSRTREALSPSRGAAVPEGAAAELGTLFDRAAAAAPKAIPVAPGTSLLTQAETQALGDQLLSLEESPFRDRLSILLQESYAKKSGRTPQSRTAARRLLGVLTGTLDTASLRLTGPSAGWVGDDLERLASSARELARHDSGFAHVRGQLLEETYHEGDAARDPELIDAFQARGLHSLIRRLESEPVSMWLALLADGANLWKNFQPLNGNERAARLAITALAGEADWGRLTKRNPEQRELLDQLDSLAALFKFVATTDPRLARWMSKLNRSLAASRNRTALRTPPPAW